MFRQRCNASGEYYKFRWIDLFDVDSSLDISYKFLKYFSIPIIEKINKFLESDQCHKNIKFHKLKHCNQSLQNYRIANQYSCEECNYKLRIYAYYNYTWKFFSNHKSHADAASLI